jgi:hypothetical protein
MGERKQVLQSWARAPHEAPQDREEPVRVMPPSTATRTTGKRPDGVGAAIQREIDEGGKMWMKNQLSHQKKLH